MTVVRIDDYVFDAKRFLYAEITGYGVRIHLEGAKESLLIHTRTQIVARERLKEVQNIVNDVLSSGNQ